MGYATMRGAVLRMTVLCKVEHLCLVFKFSDNNPALRVAPKRFLPILIVYYASPILQQPH